MREAVVVQARMGSTRLPGKVLMDLAGRTVLDHVLTRCRAIPGVAAVVCATTAERDDDPVAAEAKRIGATVFRGDEADVLGRYLGAARAVEAEVVLRVTSDCPLIDPAVCRAVLDLRAGEDADYAANNAPPTWPHGLDCEAFTVAALARAADATYAPHDREHVTPWLRRAPGLHRANLAKPGRPEPDQRWTLDTPEDLDALRRLFARLADASPDGHIPGWEEVLRVASTEPALAMLNQPRTPATEGGRLKGQAIGR